MLAAADAAGQPPWLAIVLAVITVVGVIGGPALVERIKRGAPDPPPTPDPPPAPPPVERADAALAIVQDLVDDLQRRLDASEAERRALVEKFEPKEER